MRRTQILTPADPPPDAASPSTGWASEARPTSGRAAEARPAFEATDQQPAPPPAEAPARPSSPPLTLSL